MTNENHTVFPFAMGTDFESEDLNVKMPHDRYEVFVNGDFVGRKVLLNDSDTIEQVDSFLRDRGLQAFTSKLDGDHYNLQVDDQNLASQVKDNLNVYLSLR